MHPCWRSMPLSRPIAPEVLKDYNAQRSNYHVDQLHVLDARQTLTVGSHRRQVWRGRFARLLRIRYNLRLTVSPEIIVVS